MMPAYPRMSFSFIRDGIRETLRGKSLSRILMNHCLKNFSLSGAILDIGAGSESGSYNRFLQYQSPYTITRTDFYKQEGGMIKLNLEKPFNIQDGSYDSITCFNTLEHIYAYENVVRESFRILKPGGLFIGATPFLINYHPDPHDYFRYTHETIDRVFSEHGFTSVTIFSLGFGPCSVAAEFVCSIIPRLLRIFIILPALLCDMVILLLKPHHRGRYPLGFLYSYKKPS